MQLAVLPSRSSRSGSDTNLPVDCSLLWFCNALVDVEHPGDAQLDAVQVTPDHRPQPEQAWLAGLSDLQDTGVQGGISREIQHITRSYICAMEHFWVLYGLTVTVRQSCLQL